MRLGLTMTITWIQTLGIGWIHRLAKKILFFPEIVRINFLICNSGHSINNLLIRFRLVLKNLICHKHVDAVIIIISLRSFSV